MNSFNTFITFVVLASLAIAFVATPFVRDYQKHKAHYWIAGGVILVIYLLGGTGK